VLLKYERGYSMNQSCTSGLFQSGGVTRSGARGRRYTIAEAT
jgi:hypothetical protein